MALADGNVAQVVVDTAYEQRGLEFIRRALSDGIAPEQIALLFRRRDDALPVERVLEQAGIAHNRLARSRRFFQEPLVQAALSWLRVALGSGDGDDWQRALAEPPRYLTREARQEVAEDPDPERLVADVIAGRRTLSMSAKQGVGQIQHALVRFKETLERVRQVGPAPAPMLEALGLDRSVGSDESGGGIGGEVTLRVLGRVAACFADLGAMEGWIARAEGDPDLMSAEELAGEDDRARPSHVHLSTIHGAKGREFPAVAVLGPPNGMPDPRALEGESEDEEEERRAAYVAVTRARERLLFCASDVYGRDLDMREDGLTWPDYRLAHGIDDPDEHELALLQPMSGGRWGFGRWSLTDAYGRRKIVLEARRASAEPDLSDHRRMLLAELERVVSALDRGETRRAKRARELVEELDRVERLDARREAEVILHQFAAGTHGEPPTADQRRLLGLGADAQAHTGRAGAHSGAQRASGG